MIEDLYWTPKDLHLGDLPVVLIGGLQWASCTVEGIKEGQSLCNYLIFVCNFIKIILYRGGPGGFPDRGGYATGAANGFNGGYNAAGGAPGYGAPAGPPAGGYGGGAGGFGSPAPAGGGGYEARGYGGQPGGYGGNPGGYGDSYGAAGGRGSYDAAYPPLPQQRGG